MSQTFAYFFKICSEVASFLFPNLHPDDPDYDPATSGDMANKSTSEVRWMFGEITFTNMRKKHTGIILFKILC